MTKRTICAAVAAAVLVAALAGQAFAITGGELDGAAHPQVGALVADIPGVGRVPLCSGTLISSTVFLTAGHCTAGLPALGVTRVWVSLDPTLGPTNQLYGGSYVTDPAYGHDQADLHDLSVVLLDAAVTGIAPATLPAKGLLDLPRGNGTAPDRLFTNVGYGYSSRDVGGGQPRFAYDGQRRWSTSPYSALTKSSLKLQGNANATGLGGVCFGDSGGPVFLPGSTVIAAVTSSGSGACAGPSVAYRLDTMAARDFLAPFVNTTP